MNQTSTFADLADDIPWTEPSGLTAAPIRPRPFVIEACPKCNGTGNFTSWTGRIVGKCHACKGAGKQQFRNPAPVRAAIRERAAERKVEAADAKVAAFAEANRAVYDWMVQSAPTFEFAASLLAAVGKFGSLTPNQLAAAEKCVAKRAAAKVAAVERAAAAPEVSLAPVEAAFAKASAAGIKFPKLNLGEFKLSPAPLHGKNAGAIYVKSGEQYLGKVIGGRFLSTRDCSAEQSAALVAVAADPEAAAVAYGKRYGRCAICSRELSNNESIERGIGPICAGKFGW